MGKVFNPCIAEWNKLQNVKVTVAEGDTPNIFVWLDDRLIAKFWIYPDGSVNCRTFVPDTSPEIFLFKVRCG